MQLSISEKAKVDKFINELGCRRLSRITASFVSRKTSIEIDLVKQRLLQLKNDDKLNLHYELECPNPECARTARIFNSEKEVPFGEEFECSRCEEEFVVSQEHIWVTYSPNEKYFSEEYCGNIMEE